MKAARPNQHFILEEWAAHAGQPSAGTELYRVASPYCAMFRRLLLLLVRCYQLFISPLTPPSCRYVPTCSAYAAEAIGRYGAWRGGRLALRRLGRCHPWGGAGFDPVP